MDVLSKVAHKRERFDLGHEMNDFKHRKKKYFVKLFLWE